MFGSPFYHSLTRKYITIFGNLFNNITVVKTDKTDNSEIERIRVPIAYSNKDKYFARLKGDPDASRIAQITLPRMGFELNGYSLDTTRMQNQLLRTARANNSTRVQAQYMGAPYDLTFELNVYARNYDDGNQIIEQILPYFKPDYNVSVNLIPEIGFVKDIPIILNNVQTQISVEGDIDSPRYIYWTLTFTMKAYYYGPISPTNIIRTVFAKIYIDPSLSSGSIVRINTNHSNNGTFQLEDVVFQGNNYISASAYGYVLGWNANNGKLTIGGTQGTFKPNLTIHAVSTNAAANLLSFEAGPLLTANIVTTPSPSDAEPEDDYGYSQVIIEFPDTI